MIGLTQTTINEYPLLARGKVRDIYDLGQELLIVATDRISAFDVVLPNPIPDKGRVLTGLSVYWFNETKNFLPNHLLTAEFSELPVKLRHYQELTGRFMLVKKGKVLPVECIVRGYLAGSGWKEYQKSGTVCGLPLPQGLLESSKLPEPIFTPTTKAAAGHDEPITEQQMINLVGSEVTKVLKEKSIQLYSFAARKAEEKGIIIADTKFEFAWIDGEIKVADEIFTPDSSRFWPMQDYRPGRSQVSFDKQYIRDYLESLGWDKTPPAPVLPEEVIAKTREKYLEAYRRLVGKELF